MGISDRLRDTPTFDPEAPALHYHEAEFLLQTADRRRQSRLRDMANFGCPREMPFAGESDEIFELADEHRPVKQIKPRTATKPVE